MPARSPDTPGSAEGGSDAQSLADAGVDVKQVQKWAEISQDVFRAAFLAVQFFDQRDSMPDRARMITHLLYANLREVSQVNTSCLSPREAHARLAGGGSLLTWSV